MPRPRGKDAAGRPRDLIGKPLEFRLAPIPGTGVGVRFVGQQEQNTMSKAKSDGVYTLGEGRFKVHEGDEIPEGAEFEAVDNVFGGVNAEFNAEDTEVINKAQPVNLVQRADGPAPENRARATKKSDS